MNYKKAGVDLDAAAEAKKEIAKLAKSTYQKDVLAGVGPFGAMVVLDEYSDLVLVSTIDGVGTKLKIAIDFSAELTCGIDLVNHCVNDILCQGATPRFFMDYIAQDKLRPTEIFHLIEGMAGACKEAGVSLIGGETAQMPGIYTQYGTDLVGVMFGTIRKSRIIDGSSIRPGDKILGLPSTGLHTNGYSMVNKLMEKNGWSPYFFFKELDGQLGRILLAPHKSYLKAINGLRATQDKQGFYRIINGIAHITGGGLQENIVRILPENCKAKIKLGSWPILPIFQFLEKEGKIETKEMHRVFNMGIGMVLVVSKLDVDEFREYLQSINEPVYEIGEIEEGVKSVELTSQ